MGDARPCFATNSRITSQTFMHSLATRVRPGPNGPTLYSVRDWLVPEKIERQKMDLLGLRPVNDSLHSPQSGVSHFAVHDQIVGEPHETGAPTLDASKLSGEGARAASTAPEIPVEELRRLAQTHGTKDHSSRGMQSKKILFFAAAMIVSGGAAAFNHYSEEGMATVNSASFASAPLSSQPADTRSSSHIITNDSTAPAIEPQPAQQATAIPPPQEAAPLDPPLKVQQFEAVLRDLVVVQQALQQMRSKQDDIARGVAALQASNDELKKKLTSYRLTGATRATAIQPRRPPVTAAPVQTVGQPSVPHTTVVEGPDASNKGSAPDARWPGVSRPPSPIRDN